MAPTKTRGKNPPLRKLPLRVKTIAITQTEHDLLDQLSQEASDFLGWTVSSSAIIRALVRQVAQQGPPAMDALFIEVEKELKSGVVWGKKKR